MNDTETVTQLSEAWFKARLGHVTASRIADVMAKTKNGYSASRARYMAELIVERITGQPYERYQNAAMQWGVEKEPEARSLYELSYDVTVEQVGFVKHPVIVYSGASPDGLVGAEGLVEIKCPETATHIDTLLSSTIEGKYIYQMQWQMRCTERKWADFFSYDPRMPARMQTFCKRIARDDAVIAEIEREVMLFLAELSEKITALNNKCPEVT
jgi:putative phage-type endonuclease